MSAVLAVPATVRLPRSVAARRALLTVFFLGGFLALAFLFGGSAHAASLPGSHGHGDKSAASKLLKSDQKARESARKASRAEFDKHRTEARHEATATEHKVMEPVAKSAERTGKVTRPVGKAVEGVATSVNLRGLTDRIGLHQHAGSGADSGHAAHWRTEGRSGASRTDAAYGPNAVAQHGASGTAADVASHAGQSQHAMKGEGAHHGGGSGLPPFQQAPAAPASSACQSAGDGHGPRGGKHQLAGDVTTGTDHFFGPLRAGAVRTADSAPTRERSGDVLEFPG